MTRSGMTAVLAKAGTQWHHTTRSGMTAVLAKAGS